MSFSTTVHYECADLTPWRQPVGRHHRKFDFRSRNSGTKIFTLSCSFFCDLTGENSTKWNAEIVRRVTFAFNLTILNCIEPL